MDLPPDWELRESEKYPGRCYYYNKVSRESTWIRPIPYPGTDISWPPTVFVSQILIAHNKSINKPHSRTPDEALNIAQFIVQQIIEKSFSFEQMVSEHSDDKTHIDGELGWILKGNKEPDFEKVAWNLRIGEMSTPFNTSDGYYIILRKG